MQKRRIPATLHTFHWYQMLANEYLSKIASGEILTRGEILGMSDNEMIKLNQFKTTWTSGDPAHRGIWDLHSDKTTKTQTTRADVVRFMSDFGKFFRPILVRISASPKVTNEDRDTLNIAHPVSRRSRPTLPIGEHCNAVVTIIGRGRIKVKCYYMHEGNRARKPPRADAVEIAYRMFLPHQFSPSGEKLPLMQLQGPHDNTIKIFSTKASFTLEMGAQYMGYQMQYYARWINTRHPSLAGPWTGMWAVFIG